MPKPYPVVRPTRVPISLPDGSTDCAFALEDTPDGSKQRETLLIRTHVSPQLPESPESTRASSPSSCARVTRPANPGDAISFDLAYLPEGCPFRVGALLNHR
jgi:hypothetical protein